MVNKIAIGVLSTHKFKIQTNYLLSAFGNKIEDDLYFFSDNDDNEIKNYLNLTSDNSYNSCVGKTVLGFLYFYENLLYKYDWFMSIDEDTFLNLENLDKLLCLFDSNQKYYIGQKINYWPTDRDLYYCSGGAGFILSKESLKCIYDDLLFYKNNMNYYNYYLLSQYPEIIVADVLIGKIMRKHKIDITHSDLIHGEKWEKFNSQQISYHYVKKEDMNTLSKFID